MVEAAVQEEGFTVVATTQVRGGRGGDADREARGGGVMGGGEGEEEARSGGVTGRGRHIQIILSVGFV